MRGKSNYCEITKTQTLVIMTRRGGVGKAPNADEGADFDYFLV